MRFALFLTAVLEILACLAPRPIAAETWPAELAPWMEPQAWQRDTPGPILSLGAAGQFDDRHIFAPAVIKERDQFLLWYCGSRGTPGNRVFRLGLATGNDGKQFEKYSSNPVLEFADGRHSVLTPAILRDGDGQPVREGGRLRMWFAAATLGKGGLHTLRESSSDDGVHWTPPSETLLENVYCPTVLKADDGYEMWFSDVSRRPWVIRHAASSDGRRWTVSPRPSLVLSQDWEGEVLTYPTVLKVNGIYLMWYGSYDRAIRRETTAIGLAASLDGQRWYKHPGNPVLRPEAGRPWESNYVGSGSVIRLSDGSFRYWYASRKQPPFENLYFAINTATWAGPHKTSPVALLLLPPKRGERGRLITDPNLGRSVTVLEVIDGDNAIVRCWYNPISDSNSDSNSDSKAPGAAVDATFVDVWIQGIKTEGFVPDAKVVLRQTFEVKGDQLIDTTCGKRSFPLLTAVD